MKKNHLILLLLIAIAHFAKAQPANVYALYTDRDMYVSGETLLAKIFTPEDGLSSIVYLDLVNQAGTRITGAALKIRNNQANGYLYLPDSLSSGTYLIRAYQKHSAKKIKVLREIWISNRFDGLEKTTQINRVKGVPPVQEKETGEILFSGIESEYKANQPISATIKINNSILQEIEGELLISISQTDSSFISSTFLDESEMKEDAMVERRGIIFSGTVTDKNSGENAPDITVYLTIPDSIPGFQYYITRSDGRFYFLLDRNYKQVQAVIQCFGKTQGQRLKIKLDDNFAEPGNLPTFSQLPVNEPFRNSNRRNIDAVTFQKIFDQKKLETLPSVLNSQETYPYYGKASLTVDPQLFIDLPNFTEIARELLPGVKFRNYNNTPTLQVLNSPMRNYFSETPLLLIDGIPVGDLNVIKDMGTTDIDRVDICQTERFYGDLRFPGVVAIYTTKSDYSMLPENDQLIRLKPELIQEQVQLAEPAIPEPNIPDMRQLLYWNPLVTPAENIQVKGTASSVCGHFKAIVRGRLKDGTLIFAEKYFEVK
jgi:hypothetical protein